MPTIHLTVGDIGDVIHVRGKNADGTAITAIPDTATAVFSMRRQSDGHTVSGSAQIVDGDEFKYTTVSGDTSKPGVYDAKFVVTFQSGAVRTFPSSCPKAEALVVKLAA